MEKRSVFMDYAKESLKLHEQWQGKLDIQPKMKIETRDDLSLAYTPGVAQPCLEIQKDQDKSFTLTGRGNLVAVITDGSAVLGLGNIGPEAGMPVMEGKCVLFKAFADVNAIPLCVRSQNVDEIVHTIALLAGSFGGINLEDIAAPRCFEIERRLKELCDIPIFHDDQHGTAIVVAAALMNALKVAKKAMGSIEIVINGAGSAGCAIAKLLLDMQFGHIILCDKKGILQLEDELSFMQREIVEQSPPMRQGSLADAMKGADVFIGVSAPKVVDQEMISSMNSNAIVFPMANPIPEISREEALAAGAMIVGTGRSDLPNQINNVLAFPGIFKGALEVRASDINEAMKHAAAKAIAGMIPSEELNVDYIIPSALNRNVANCVSEAVAQAAIESGVARIKK